MSLSGAILEHSLVYRLWQAPFAEQKFSPVRAHNDLSRTRRVLDVACGPGTNTHHFAHSDYIGVDFNERYIAMPASVTAANSSSPTCATIPPPPRIDLTSSW